LGFVPQPNLPR